MSKLQVTEFTSVTGTEVWCENPQASMQREGFNLPWQSYLLPKSYAKSQRQNSVDSATEV
eukprot:473498-Rhodomonas_salina.1